MRIMSLCLCIAFLCMSVCLSACLSKSLHIFVCMPVSLNICGVVPADQGSRARYRAFPVFCWDSKSVPLLVEAHYNGTKLCIIYPWPVPPSPMSKSWPDVFLIFQCFGTCPTPAQGDILVSDKALFLAQLCITNFLSELRVRLVEAFQYMYFFC